MNSGKKLPTVKINHIDANEAIAARVQTSNAYKVFLLRGGVVEQHNWKKFRLFSLQGIDSWRNKLSAVVWHGKSTLPDDPYGEGEKLSMAGQ